MELYKKREELQYSLLEFGCSSSPASCKQAARKITIPIEEILLDPAKDHEQIQCRPQKIR